MKECRYCKQLIPEEADGCPACGYDPKTDTLNPALKSKKPVKNVRAQKETISRGMDWRVKRFVLIGVGITFFSVLYKYNFDPRGIIYEARQWIAIIVPAAKKIPFLGAKEKKEEEDTMRFTDMRSFEKSEDTNKYKGVVLIEGIFFDPGGKSFVTANGMVLAEGEVIQGVTIRNIFPESVALEFEGQTVQVGLQETLKLPRRER
ncbi:MAG: hypothetical protein KKC84_02985 [Candidatus Omnitrophica bacterium]|nr:hypothetical protein [Candidatus Omnitrophota bacterium]